MMMDYQGKSSPVAAPIISQPSLPIVSFPLPRDKKALGISNDAFRATQQWAEQQQTKNPDFKIPAFRFEEDFICPKECFETLEKEFGSKINLRIITQQERKRAGIPKNKTHSVLTGYSGDLSSLDPTEQARKEAIEYLKRQLST